MKILIIGGNGTIGGKLTEHFSKDNDVIIAGRSSGDLIVDISDSKSIQGMLELAGKLDAIICCAGEARWAPFEDLSEDDYYIGIRSKLMGQVNLTRLGKDFLNSGGSITLTTGILADDPVLKTASAAMVNGAIHSFVRAAALELTNGIRINVVSAGVVQDSYEKYRDYFPGYYPIAMDRVALAYERCVKGSNTGEVVRIYN